MTGIYKITSPSGKVYIGQSRNIVQRWRNHRTPYGSTRSALFSSFKKYGRDAHKFETAYLLPDGISQDVLNEYEIFFINQFKEGGVKLLNLTHGGSYGKHSEETIKKMRILGTGRLHSDETKDKLRKFRLSYKITDETKAKMSATHTGMKRSQTAIEKHRAWSLLHNPIRGKKRSSESIAKQKISNLNRPKISESTRLKMSLARKTYWEHINNK